MDATGPDPALSADSFTALYQACYPTIAKLAYGVVLDREQANDIAHEAFLRLWGRRDSLREHSNRKAWLVRVAVNLAISQRRAIRVAIRYRGWPEPTPDPADLALRQLELAAMHRALLRLSPRERAVLALRFQQNYAFGEMSSILDARPSTLRTQLARALRKLESYLAVEAVDTHRRGATITSSEVHNG